METGAIQQGKMSTMNQAEFKLLHPGNSNEMLPKCYIIHTFFLQMPDNRLDSEVFGIFLTPISGKVHGYRIKVSAELMSDMEKDRVGSYNSLVFGNMVSTLRKEAFEYLMELGPKIMIDDKNDYMVSLLYKNLETDPIDTPDDLAHIPKPVLEVIGKVTEWPQLRQLVERVHHHENRTDCYSRTEIDIPQASLTI